MKLAKKIALITGATGTIGGAIARRFAEEGCHLVLSGRSQEQLKKIQNELAPLVSVEIFPADVADLKSVRECLAFVEEKFKQLDILVCAAGTFGEIGTLEQCDPDKWRSAVEVNLFGTMWCVKYALPLLKKSAHPAIITFAGGGEGPLLNFSAYVSSKGGVVRLTETLAAELSSYSIPINAISPGLVNSGLMQDIIEAGVERAGDAAFHKAQIERTGEGEAVSPDKAAALAVFLASDKAHGLSGKNISAIWDHYEDIPEHLAEIMKSDVYNWRRIKPKDRGYGW